MPLEQNLARKLSSVQTKRHLRQFKTIPFDNFFRGAILGLGLLTTAGSASARPPQEIRAEQVDLSRLTEQELIGHLEQILGTDVVEDVLGPPRFIALRSSWRDERRDRPDGLTSYELDGESPAQKLANKQGVRARTIDLANRLRPFVEEAKRRRLSWANRFDNYLEIPSEPRVDFADGEFKSYSNFALLGKLKEILGVDVVEDVLGPPRFIALRSSWRDERRDRPDGLTSYELDGESPAQKLANRQGVRARAIDLANRLRPFVEEAKRRRLSWANRFDNYLEIPSEPRVDFADGEFKSYSNFALLGKLKEILGVDVVGDVLNPGEVALRAAYSWERRDRPDGLTRYDLEKESPAQELANRQGVRARTIDLANRLRPFVEEAKRRRLSWANRFDNYLEIPSEPRVDFADGAFGSFSNQLLLDKTIEILGSDRTARILSYNYDFGLHDRSDLIITEDEASRLTLLLAEVSRRHLSWFSKVERFLPKTERSHESAPKTPEKQDPIVAKQISVLEAQAKSKYGIRIAYGNAPSAPEYSAAQPTNQQLIKSELTKLLELLTKYPPNIRSRFRNTTVYLAVDLKLKVNGKDVSGLGGDSHVVIDLSSGMEWGLDHEYFHVFDGKKDNLIWSRANPHGMADYDFSTGKEALAAGQKAIPPTGFACTYGKKGGPNEDQSTVGQALLNPITANSSMRRAKGDEVLRGKMERLTGCLFDVRQGRFVRQLTKEEYQARFGFLDFEYYAKWSRTPKGKFTMDPAFWNAIADGNPKKFE